MSGLQAACDYCGLPLPRAWWRRKSDTHGDGGPQFCCSGCRLADELKQAEAGDGSQNSVSSLSHLLPRLGLAVFLTLNVMVFTMALWTEDVYDLAAEASRLDAPLHAVFRYLSLLLTLPVLWLLGGPLVAQAWQQIRQGRPGGDLLLVLGVATSVIYSAVSVARGAGHIYLEVACVILVLVTIGRWLESSGKRRATAALDALTRLLPERARRRENCRDQWIPLGEVLPGDVLHVLAGETIPADGELLVGQAAVDERLLTGESQSVAKQPGSALVGGTLNLDGDLLLRATAAGGRGTVERLVAAVQQARQSKGYYQRLADRVAAGFLPVMMAIALGTFFWHWRAEGLDRGLLAGLSVVLIACPCALGLATPLAIWSALGRAALAGVLFRNDGALERLAKVRAICFDKTGTLTTDIAEVVEVVAAASAEPGPSSASCDGSAKGATGFAKGATGFASAEANFNPALAKPVAPAPEWASVSQAMREKSLVIAVAAALARNSNHPVSAAVARYAERKSVVTRDVTVGPVRSLSGRGLTAEVAEMGPVLLGTPAWLTEQGLAMSPGLLAAVQRRQATAAPLVCVGWQGAVQGLFALSEQLRPEAKAAVAELRERKFEVEVLTGDHRARAAQLATELGLRVRGELLPEQKLKIIEQYHRDGMAVAMVGDGINDAPALAAADVGIAMGCGADVSREAADVCLIGSDLRRLLWAYDLAQATTRTIRQNLAWAFAYNVAGVALACTGWLNPMWASAAMVVSSLLVVNNSLRAGRTADRRETGEVTSTGGGTNSAKPTPIDNSPVPMISAADDGSGDLASAEVPAGVTV